MSLKVKVSTIRLSAGWDGILGPLRSFRPGSLCCSVCFEYYLGTSISILNPLGVSMKLQDILLETFLRQLVSSLWFPAESVGVSSSMIGHDAPTYGGNRTQTPPRVHHILEGNILCCWSVSKPSSRTFSRRTSNWTSVRIASCYSTWTEHWRTAWMTPGISLNHS